MTPSAILRLRVVDGARQPFEGNMLVTLFDGAQRLVHRAVHIRPHMVFTIPFTDGPNDIYRVIVSAKDRLDAGQAAVRLSDKCEATVDVMLLPRRSVLRFQPLTALAAVHARLESLVTAFLIEKFGTGDEAAYQKLQENNPAGLLTLLSIASGFAGFGAGAPQGSPPTTDSAGRSHPLDFIQKLTELTPERFFATARGGREGMVDWLSSSPRTFTTAPHGLHRGSFCSFKEVRFPEGNVQFTFSNVENEPGALVVDCDIDLFRDTASHLLIEVFPTDALHLNSGTDPRQAYAFRWMSVQRVKNATGLDFNPPFAVVKG